MAKKLTQEEAVELVKLAQDKQYILISQYTKMDQPATLFHLKCNSIIKIARLKDFINEGKGRCKQCYPIIPTNNSRKPIKEEEFLERFKEIMGNEYKYLGGFKLMNDLVSIKHLKCGTIFNSSPKMMLGTKQTRCPHCSNLNRGQYNIKENYLEEILNNSLVGDEYEWLEEYTKDNKKKLSIRHKKCDFVYKVRPNDFQQGYMCPLCSKNTSKETLLIHKILLENKVLYETEEKFSKCVNIQKLPFDFYIPSFNLLLEFDGMQHFKQSYGNRLSGQKKNDAIKNNFCSGYKTNFIRLHYKLKQVDIEMILQELLQNNGKLTEATIEKYSLYVKQDNFLYNETNYYLNLNSEYFKS